MSTPKLLEYISATVHDQYNSKDDVLRAHILIHMYVTANANATFTRPRNHYLAIARHIVKSVIGCGGVPAGAKFRFRQKMLLVQRVFRLMYREHEFRVSWAAQSDMYTFLNRANWTQVVSNRRKLLLSRCFLLTNYKPENYFGAENCDGVLSNLTTMLPYDIWSIIYSYV